MYGGGKFLTMNKKSPGVYINNQSIKQGNYKLSDRGILTTALKWPWLKDEAMTKITVEDFQKDSLSILGYEYTAPELKNFREMFRNAKVVLVYKLNKGVKAKNEFAEAVCGGIRGNDLKISIIDDINIDGNFIVETILGNISVDSQSVKDAKELVANDFVTFLPNATLSVVVAKPLEGGADGEVTGQNHQNYLDISESYGFNIMAVNVTDEITKGLYIQTNKRHRDAEGINYQLVIHDKETKIDYEGVIAVYDEVKVKDDDKYSTKADLVYWVGGAEAGCELTRTVGSKVYDGEYDIEIVTKNSILEELMEKGRFNFHRNEDDIIVFKDINTLVTYTDTKNSDFANNQLIRYIDHKGLSQAEIFIKGFLDKVNNTPIMRTSLWDKFTSLNEQYEDLGIITNFDIKQCTIVKGLEKDEVVYDDVTEVVFAMNKLYITNHLI